MNLNAATIFQFDERLSAKLRELRSNADPAMRRELVREAITLLREHDAKLAQAASPCNCYACERTRAVAMEHAP